MPNKNIKIKNQELRKRAEAVLNKLSLDNDVTFPTNIKRLLHELQVYRVELEMQNDELHDAQNELQQSRNRFANLYDHAPVGYVTLGPKGEILMVNIAAGRLLGIARKDLIGKNLSNYISKADKDLFYIYLSHVFGGDKKQTTEIKFLNNKNFAVYVQLDAVLVEGEKGIRMCRMILTDITERKITEAHLRESEASLREAQELANIGSWNINTDTGKVTASPQLYTILGLRRTEPVTAQVLQKFVHPEDNERVQQLYDKIKQDAQPFSLTYRILLRDGRERWLYSSNKAETNANAQIIRLSGFIQDVTEQKEATELRIQAEKLELTANFARIIAHEVRNPLTTVNLSLSMLASETKKAGFEKLNTYVAAIARNVKRIDQLITQLLYSSRRSESIFTPVHICTLLDDALKEAADRIEISKVEIQKKYMGNCVVNVEVETITIALLSIIINAIEATAAKAGKVTIITEQRSNECFITIRDNGSGIKPALLKRVFEPFYTTKKEGMGLGLTNTKTIIERNHGKITVESESGLGTSFIIVLPVYGH